MLSQSTSRWMKAFPVEANKLTLKELKNFKDFHKLLTSDLIGPEGHRYYVQSFRFLYFFAIACITENRYPALTKCWHELEGNFMSDPIFDDELFIPSWIFFDFPLNREGETILDGFKYFLAESGHLSQFTLFIDEMKRSRLGLYQEVMSSKKVTKFKELITGKVISTIRSVPEYGSGEIFLTRIVGYQDQFFQFGDPKCWPAIYKESLLSMVINKLFYFEGDSTEKVYKKIHEVSRAVLVFMCLHKS